MSGRAAIAGAAVVALLFTGPAAPAARQGCTSQSITRIGGVTNNGPSEAPSISADGRFVAFESTAPDLDGDIERDVFVHDRMTCTFEVVSVSSTGIKGNSESKGASISDDGRFVAFVSWASNLVPSDANVFPDAYVRDRQLGITVLVSVDSAEAQPVGSASSVSISGNGQFVTFISAQTLVAGDTNAEADVFVRDLVAGTTERVSVSTAGQEGDSSSSTGVFDPVISEDGRFVAFRSSMTDLVTSDLNNTQDIFVRDRVLNTTVRASLDSNGAEVVLSIPPTGPAITDDGRLVFFSTTTNLVPGNGTCDGIFMRDLQVGTTSCPVLDPANATSSQNADRPSVSGDGRYVAFSSSAQHYVQGDESGLKDVFVHDRTTGTTQRASVNAFGIQANGPSSAFTPDFPDLSANGQVVAFESLASNLAPADTNMTADVFSSVWSALPSTPHVSLMRNGSFASGLLLWQTFATPDSSYIVTDTSTGELQFYRLPPPPGTSNQAVVFQQTGAQLLPHAPVEVRFRLGNSSTARKRISVLVHDADFSDLSVCTFWLPAGAPMRNYMMRTHTTEFWSNATISFYAATAGSDGGFYRIDDVSLISEPILDDDITDCIDPTAPVAPGGAPGPTLLTNGDFSGGLAPWTTFGQITWQIASSVFEFFRPAGTPAGVVLQATGQPLVQNDIVTATFYLGNSSTVRKRATVLLHDNDFSDLSVCTFWLAPQSPLAPYLMRTFATKAWTNATFSVYPSTVGIDEWIRFTDAVLQLTPGTAPLGAECLEPGADSVVVANRGLPSVKPAAARVPRRQAPAVLPQNPSTIAAGTAEPKTLWQTTVDLRDAAGQVSSFELRVPASKSAGDLEISLDEVKWTTVARLPESADRRSLGIDLSAFAGEIVHLRLVRR